MWQAGQQTVSSGARFRIAAIDRFAAAADKARGRAGGAHDKGEGRDVLRDHRAHADHGEGADFKPGADPAARADGRARANDGRQGVFVGIGAAKLLKVGRRGTRKPVVGEDRAGRDHHAGFDRHPGRDIDVRVDLDPVGDGHAIGDIGLAADDAVAPDPGRSAQVDVVPDRGTLADLDTAFDDRGRDGRGRSSRSFPPGLMHLVIAHGRPLARAPSIRRPPE